VGAEREVEELRRRLREEEDLCAKSAADLRLFQELAVDVEEENCRLKEELAHLKSCLDREVASAAVQACERDVRREREKERERERERERDVERETERGAVAAAAAAAREAAEAAVFAESQRKRERVREREREREREEEREREALERDEERKRERERERERERDRERERERAEKEEAVRQGVGAVLREVEEVVGRSLGLRQAMEEAVEAEERAGRVRRASEVRKPTILKSQCPSTSIYSDIMIYYIDYSDILFTIY
jgi:hypothetical protein